MGRQKRGGGGMGRRRKSGRCRTVKEEEMEEDSEGEV